MSRGTASCMGTVSNGRVRKKAHSPLCCISSLICPDDGFSGSEKPRYDCSTSARMSIISTLRRSPRRISSTMPDTGDVKQTFSDFLKRKSTSPASTLSPWETSSLGATAGKSSGKTAYNPSEGTVKDTFSARPLRCMFSPFLIRMVLGIWVVH